MTMSAEQSVHTPAKMAVTRSYPNPAHMKTVLAPIDFSAASKHVIESAIALARAIEARLILLHVVAPFPAMPRRIATTMSGTKLTVGAERRTAKKLNSLQRSLRDDGVTAHVVHVRGNPGECILEQAVGLAANFVVMGSHGHSTYPDLLMGSTTSAVLRRAARPIVIVPTQAAGAWEKKPHLEALSA